jgi:hypothetical protein
LEDKSVTVGSSTSLNVKLQAMAKSLDEVVVAYGKQTAKSIVGSVYNRQQVLQKQQATMTVYKEV